MVERGLGEDSDEAHDERGPYARSRSPNPYPATRNVKGVVTDQVVYCGKTLAS